MFKDVRHSWHCSSESQKLINKALAPEGHVLPLLALGTVVHFGLLTLLFQEDAGWVCFSLARISPIPPLFKLIPFYVLVVGSV